MDPAEALAGDGCHDADGNKVEYVDESSEDEELARLEDEQRVVAHKKRAAEHVAPKPLDAPPVLEVRQPHPVHSLAPQHRTLLPSRPPLIARTVRFGRRARRPR